MSPIHESSPTSGVEQLRALDSRRSVPAKQLAEPGPDEPTLLRMLRSAVRVPDHGKRVPFRLVAIRGDARHRLGERVAARGLELDPDRADSAGEKDRMRFSHAPVVVMVVALLGEDERIPAQERLLTAGCVCFSLLQAAQACGFGASWLTGWPAYDEVTRELLGVARDEAIAGFIHIGTSRIHPPERERPDPADLLTEWAPL